VIKVVEGQWSVPDHIDLPNGEQVFKNKRKSYYFSQGQNVYMDPSSIP